MLVHIHQSQHARCVRGDCSHHVNGPQLQRQPGSCEFAPRRWHQQQSWPKSISWVVGQYIDLPQRASMSDGLVMGVCSTLKYLAVSCHGGLWQVVWSASMTATVGGLRCPFLRQPIIRHVHRASQPPRSPASADRPDHRHWIDDRQCSASTSIVLRNTMANFV